MAFETVLDYAEHDEIGTALVTIANHNDDYGLYPHSIYSIQVTCRSML